VMTFTQLTLALAPGLHSSKAGALRRRIEPGWQARGACVDTDDPDAWFPARTAPPDGSTGCGAALPKRNGTPRSAI
jgi:hypothetical protein